MAVGADAVRGNFGNVKALRLIMPTHAPPLMTYPNATLLRFSKYGLEPTRVEQTDHTKSSREFFDDPRGFVGSAINSR